MRVLSAAILVLAGAICFSAGALVSHSDTQVFVMFCGGVLAAVGLSAWWAAFRSPYPD